MRLRISLLVLALLAADQLFAGNPYLTDDPYVPAERWEINLGAAYGKTDSEDDLALPIIDLNYTLLPERLQLTGTFTGMTAWPSEAGERSGLADTSFELKWVVHQESDASALPQVSIKPGLTIPTGSHRRRLGDHVWHARLPV